MPTVRPGVVRDASTQQLSSDDDPTELIDDVVAAGTSTNVAAGPR